MKRRWSILFFSTVFLISCQGNIFSELSSKTSDEDYIFLAQEFLDSKDYDSAITVITTKLSPEGQTVVKAREILASSYGGKCGLNFVDYTQKLSAQTTGSSFYMMMSPFIGVAIAPDFCRQALNTMELIGTTATRTTNQNAFVAVLGMVLIGTALRGYADISPALGDGTADVDLCTGVTDPQIDDIVIGFGFMSKNFSAVSQNLVGGSSFTAFDTVINTCASTAGTACQITDPAAITIPLRDTVRDLANTVEYGIGVYATGGNDLLLPGACP
jgi:hypothetical protein